MPTTISSNSVTLNDGTTNTVLTGSGGNLGLGTSSPSTKLFVQRSAGSTPLEDLRVTDGTQFVSVNNNSSVGAYNGLVQAGDALIIAGRGSIESGALVIGPWSASNKGIRIASDGTIATGGNPITNCKTTAKAWVNFNGVVISTGSTAASGTSLVVTAGSNQGTWNYTAAFTASHVGAIYYFNIGGSSATLGGVNVSSVGVQINSFVSANQVTFTLLAGNATSSQTVNGNGTSAGYTFYSSGIRSSYNVSSITKIGTGNYTVNFATAMTDANYSVALTADDTGGVATMAYENTASSRSVNAFRIGVTSNAGTAGDRPYISATVFGN
jgi:hypothetical protein